MPHKSILLSNVPVRVNIEFYGSGLYRNIIIINLQCVGKNTYTYISRSTIFQIDPSCTVLRKTHLLNYPKTLKLFRDNVRSNCFRVRAGSFFAADQLINVTLNVSRAKSEK